MDDTDRPAVATLLASSALIEGRPQTLSEESAHHIRVVRASIGDPVELRDGAGAAATGTLIRLTRTAAVVDVHSVWTIDPAPPVHLLAPIADRERMLWLAEKTAELGLTSWRPVMWRRSRSVSPRGEGTMFQQKLRARMSAAMLQSRGGWVPQTFPDATLERAIGAAAEGARLLLDAEGEPMLAARFAAPVTLALGPEGGLEPREREALSAAGFTAVSLGQTHLRFETAGVAAVAIARAQLALTADSRSTQDRGAQS